ncbi:PREDICTED: trophoblast glycoprotein-like [Priapulus caudatus]|uniref:Trophoblast glycoprotein-like n=1 Tax=Priapulus caudatus TaxID=37621 RepID=A0ABM1EM65_PRICU|nr:PREDICTED: trophoblast glycoprotein-like [Priapulus caudatus]
MIGYTLLKLSVTTTAVKRRAFSWMEKFPLRSSHALMVQFEGAFDGLSSLKTLDISNNDIGGELPAEIFRNLATLQSLHINHIQLKKLLGDVFVDQRNLRALWLVNNSFSSVDDFLPSLRALPRLETLEISQNPIQ